jgi:hypothetical protein
MEERREGRKEGRKRQNKTTKNCIETAEEIVQKSTFRQPKLSRRRPYTYPYIKIYNYVSILKTDTAFWHTKVVSMIFCRTYTECYDIVDRKSDNKHFPRMQFDGLSIQLNQVAACSLVQQLKWFRLVATESCCRV